MQIETSLLGLWRRRVIRRPDVSDDRETLVYWLQGPGFYADLRLPKDRPSFADIAGWRDLDMERRAWMATQQGFAGVFETTRRADGALIGTWHREIDLQPPTDFADRGVLSMDGDLLIETGIETAYLEEWAPEETGVADPCWGLRLYDASEQCSGFLVRAGATFIYARDRPSSAMNSLDVEISMGTIEAAGGTWRILHSTLPWRENKVLAAEIDPTAALLTVSDVAEDGTPRQRDWRITEREVAPVLFNGFTAIPVIDIADLMEFGAEGAPKVVAQLAEAARKVGFFSVVGHGCPVAVSDRLIARSKEFFALPLERKMAVYIGNSNNHRGYVPSDEEVLAIGIPDRKEAYDLSMDLAADDPDIAGKQMLGPNQWPDLPGFAEDVGTYYDTAFGIGMALMRAFAVALGRPETFFDGMITKPPSQLRLIHYPHDPEAVDRPGMGAHTDYECLTVLLPTAAGLEVMNGNGQWIDAPPVPGGLTINIGDMLELMSDGEFIATSHRVRKVAEERYSFPLFFNLDYDTRVSSLRDPQGRSLIAGEHLYAQTVQTFRYLKTRLEKGELSLPVGALALSSFGQEARYGGGRPYAPETAASGA